MPYCAFDQCINHSGHMNKMRGITFHKFPANKECEEEWINIIRTQRRDPDWIPTRYSRVPDKTDPLGDLQLNQPSYLPQERSDEANMQEEIKYAQRNHIVIDDEERDADHVQGDVGTDQGIKETCNMAANDNKPMPANPPSNIKDQRAIGNVAATKMEPTPSTRLNNAEENSVTDKISANETQQTAAFSLNYKHGNPADSGPLPLDKFKRRLVRAVARQIQQKKPEEEMWKELKKEIGCDCYMLWQHMRALTMKKLKRLLPANDLLVNLKKIARFTATDWLLFDLILVHEKINVINVSEATEEAAQKEEPSCLRDLFELVKQHDVENLTGDELTEAWIRVTLQYNSSGRQCSPMLLQLRWYQLKELARARFYNFWCAYRGNTKILERAMQYKPTALQTAIAAEYKKIVTEIFPDWEKCIEQRRVILSEEFTMNRELKRKSNRTYGKSVSTTEENEVELEVIEPQVEIINLDVNSDEEMDNNDESACCSENIATVTKQEIAADAHGNRADSKEMQNSATNVRSDSDDEVLDLKKISDVEAIHISIECQENNIDTESHAEQYKISSEEILNSNTNEMLPKITNVIGNIEESQLDDRRIKNLEEKQYQDDESETIIKETDETTTVQCDSDDEMEKILQEKADNLMNLKITQIKSEVDSSNEISKTERVISPKINELASLVMPYFSNNEPIQCDSDDEIEKVLVEKANYICFEVPKLTQELDEDVAYNPNISENNVTNKDEIAGEEIDEENSIDGITYEGQTVKKEKHDDTLDEVDFDDEQVEFVDDGIEFIEETDNTQNSVELKTESTSDLEEDTISETNSHAKIDLKLLMNPTVLTVKLDQMEVFKFIDYKYVTDEKVIKCAIQESKPVDEKALQAELIDKFREQALHGNETDDTQSDNDIVQTTIEYAHERVKCTSWLLHKPKNRSYNPIQLCKNPDFNTRLKRLTSGFLSSTRNRVLLKECKPLTIDLHKAFENKLINGTMYLKSGDFKSAKSTTAENKNNETASVLPSAIPGQAMIIATPITNDISTMTSNKSDNLENEVSLSSTDRSIANERRKVISLPDIDQVRRLNQSLLTAEVTPIRVESNVNNATCKEPPQVSNVVPFVQPITIEPFIQVKKENPESEASNNMNTTNVSAKVSMVHKINDQIIDLSNQISEFDKNEVVVENLLTEQSVQKKKIGRPKCNFEKTKSTQPNKLTYTPLYKNKITWTPKYAKNYVEDSLLTRDTLSKILFVLNGKTEGLKNCVCKKKKKKKHLVAEHQADTQPLKETPKETDELEANVQPKEINAQNQKKTNQRPKKTNTSGGVKKYTGLYCCWARERILCIAKNRPNTSGHGCLKFQCRCCCRQEFVTLTTWKRTQSYHKDIIVPPPKEFKNNNSTIVLSDDEDVLKRVNQIKKEVVTNQVIDGHISKLEIASSTCNTDPNNVNVAMNSPDVAAEVVIPPSTSTTDSINIGDHSQVTEQPLPHNSQKVSVEKNDQFKNKKICVTNVRAGDNRRYKKGIEHTKNIYKKDVPSMPVNRTLYINSSQLLNKPIKTPIYLGKNKMLLCSLKNRSINEPVAPALPVLPHGVHLRVTTSGELTIAIDNGVQLDQEQLSALPALISVIQQQIDSNNKVLYNNTPVFVDDNVKTTKNRRSTVNVVANSVEDLDNTKDLGNTSAENFNDFGDNGAPLLNLNEIVAKEINQQDIDNIRTDSEEPTEEKNARIDEENQKDEPQLENQEHNDISSKQPPQESTSKDKDESIDSENKNSSSRKTILSDLMEMSGISAEDTVVTDVIESFPAVASLPPTIIPVTSTNRTSGETINLPTCSNVSKDISIAGPYSNLLSLQPTSPVNHLLNCIAQIRPELNAVTSFADLKYVYENDGLFYKLDLDTGIISEIKVVIKKNPKSKVPTEPKAFIDLTEDPGESDPEMSCTFQDIPQEKQTLVEAKPIKLFKSVRPLILKSGRGRSILKDIEIVYPKKKILIDKKHKRKQLLKVGDKFVLVDSETTNKRETTETPATSTLDSSYDSSDDEPLAKKCKRNLYNENNTEKSPAIFDELPEPNSPGEEREPFSEPQVPDMTGDMSDQETNNMEIEGVNPELHPVAFEEGSESDEDMCILGV